MLPPCSSSTSETAAAIPGRSLPTTDTAKWRIDLVFREPRGSPPGAGRIEMAMSASEIAEERRRGRFAGVTAIAAGLLFPVGLFWFQIVNNDRPEHNAPAQLRFFDRHATELLISSAIRSAAFALIVFVALHLYRATKARNPQLSSVVAVVGVGARRGGSLAERRTGGGRTGPRGRVRLAQRRGRAGRPGGPQAAARTGGEGGQRETEAKAQTLGCRDARRSARADRGRRLDLCPGEERNERRWCSRRLS